MGSPQVRMIRWTVVAAFMAIALQTGAEAAVIHVKPTGSDANSGASWAEAKRTIQAAIQTALSLDEVWVAAGTYQERISNKVVGNAAVDVALYGGFAGTETSREQRNWDANPTIVDGTNSGIVVTISHGAGSQTRLDGFYIIRGLQGGIAISNSAPVIANNTIKDNLGTGILIHKYKIIQVNPPLVAHPTIRNNRIVDNVAVNGGGIAVTGDLVTNLVPAPPSSPVILNNVIARNEAYQNGGGIGCWGHTAAVILNNYILANSASTYEPGWDGEAPIAAWLVGGGGIFASKRDMAGVPIEYAVSAPTIANNVVAANGGLLGGGICLVNYPMLSQPNNPPPIVTNNTVVANNGAGIYWGETFPKIRNNLVAFNTWGIMQDESSNPEIGHNNVYGNAVQGERSDYWGIADQTGLNGNISADPKMALYRMGEFHIQPNSPCINAGTPDALEAGWTDIDGQNRVIGAGVDIGADESDGTLWPSSVPIIHVKPTGNDAQSGRTWAEAKRTVAGGIQEAAKTGAEVWVAAGTYAERITIPAFVYLYGGFAGTETSRESRNIPANPTILDGQGIPTVVLSKNAGYLVSALDGFTVQNGGVFRGNVFPDPSWGVWGVEGRGGGIRCAVASLFISNNTVKRNSFGNPFRNADLRGHGAGIHGYQTFSIIRGNTITENEILNTFDGRGAGLYFKLSMPSIEENTISRNHARNGSAVYCSASIPKILRNRVEENSMYILGLVYTGSFEGAITIDLSEDFLIEGNIIRGNIATTGAGIHVKTNLAGRIQNNVIADNIAGEPVSGGGFSNGMGGGIYCILRSDAIDHHYVVNNTIVGNTATGFQEQGGGIALSLPPPLPPPQSPPPGMLVVANNILAFNSSGIFQTLTTPMLVPTLLNNNLYNGIGNYINLSPGPNSISADPLFLNRQGGDFRLRPNSPCIDAGENGVTGLSETDIEGKPRIQGARVDMGAYETPFGGAKRFSPAVLVPLLLNND